MKRVIAIVISLLSFPCIITVFSLFGFLVGSPVSKFYAPISFLLSIVICALITNEKRRQNCFIVGSVILFSVFLSALPVMYCVSDAINCYRVGVAMMVDGWNPLIETEVADISKYGSGFNPWHVAYAFKLPFIYGASLCKTLGFSSAGDSLNFILFAASFLTLYYWLRKERGVSRLISTIITLLLLSSPNVVRLFVGGKSDPVLYHCLVLILVSCENFRINGKLSWMFILLGAMVVACGIKATGLLFGFIICISYLVFILIDVIKKRMEGKKLKQLALFVCVSIVLAIVFNPSPFITSTIKHGTPFYPMITADGSEVPHSVTQLTNDCDIMNEDAKELGLVGRYTRAYLSESAVDWFMSCRKGRSFSPSWPELFTKPVGYGIFFRVAFVLSLIGWFFVKDNSFKRMALAVFLTTLVVPTKFVGLANYVQQIYLIPIIVGIGLSLRVSARCANIFFLVIGVGYCILMSYKSLLFIPYVWLSSVQSLQILEMVKEDHNPVIESRYYYGQFLWRHDSCRSVEIVSSYDEIEEERGIKKYGPIARRYDYITKNNIASDFYSFNFNDVGRNQGRRRDGVERFFVKEFLPVEWRYTFKRIGQWYSLRKNQLFNAWRTM